jgi:ribosome modulation factor
MTGVNRPSEDELIFFLGVEGAADYAAGRPFDRCPYSRANAEIAWHSWREGWLAASFHESSRGEAERRRWWVEAA